MGAPLLAVLILVGACDTPTVQAGGPGDAYAPYRYALSTGEVVRWPTGSTVRVFLAGGGAAEREVLLTAFRRGARAWQAAVPHREYRLERADRPESADVVIGWSDARLPVETEGCRPEVQGAGVTTFCRSERRSDRLHAFPLRDSDGPHRSPVRMVVLLHGDLATSAERAARVATHELGHVLGIATHSGNADDLMWSGRLMTAGPSPADRTTVHLLYHTPPDLVP